MAPTLFWFGRHDERVGILSPLGAVLHREELGGEDAIELACREEPAKYDRLLWRDPEDGRWREHVVATVEGETGGPSFVRAESSLCDLLAGYIESARLTNAGIVAALSAALSGTRWTADIEGTFGTASAYFYHLRSLAALRRAADVWGFELEPVIEVEGGRVAGRAVRAVPRLGCDRGMRFEHAHNLAGCRRAVLEDEVCTALYGYGAGIPVVDETGAFTGGYRRKLTFGEVNGGVNWVGDEAARLAWGLPDADGTGRVHRFGEVTFADVEDPQTLKERTLAALPEACAPKVRYEVDAALVEGSDRAGLGDDVAVVDASRDPEWRFKSRVVGRARTFGDGWTDVQLTIGQPKSTAYAAASEATARATAAEDAAGAAGDVALAARSGVDALNEAAGAAEDGTVPALATKAYVDAAIAALDDLSEVEF